MDERPDVPDLPDDQIALDRAERTIAGQFAAGVSGNPGGRPKTKLFSARATARLAEICDYDVPLARKEGRAPRTWLDVLVDSLLKQSAKGDIAALKELLNRTEGKVGTSSTVKVDGEVRHDVRHTVDVPAAISELRQRLAKIRERAEQEDRRRLEEPVDAEVVPATPKA
jgi:hypothetical protein